MSKTVPKKRKPIPEDEKKDARFIRVVTPRINKAVKAISNIGNCSGSNYSFTAEQVQKMTNVLIEAIGNMTTLFAAKKQKQDSFGF